MYSLSVKIRFGFQQCFIFDVYLTLLLNDSLVRLTLFSFGALCFVKKTGFPRLGLIFSLISLLFHRVMNTHAEVALMISTGITELGHLLIKNREITTEIARAILDTVTNNILMKILTTIVISMARVIDDEAKERQSHSKERSFEIRSYKLVCIHNQ